MALKKSEIPAPSKKEREKTTRGEIQKRRTITLCKVFPFGFLRPFLPLPRKTFSHSKAKKKMENQIYQVFSWGTSTLPPLQFIFLVVNLRDSRAWFLKESVFMFQEFVFLRKKPQSFSQTWFSLTKLSLSVTTENASRQKSSGLPDNFSKIVLLFILNLETFKQKLSSQPWSFISVTDSRALQESERMKATMKIVNRWKWRFN